MEMTRRIDLTHRQFGRLTVIGPSYRQRNKTVWLCRCDCGVEKVVQAASLVGGTTKSCGCLRRGRVGDKHPLWKGGFITKSGYRMQPYTDENGKRKQVFVHRIVMERVLGRPLLPTETVHHKNGDRLDNREENLELWASRQPKGSRVTDLIANAVQILELYKPELLR